MMRLFLGLLIGLLWSLGLMAQCPNEWAQQISAAPNGMLAGQRLNVAVDGNGNAFVSNVINNAQGVTVGGQTFADFTAEGINISASISKFQADGQFSWLKVLAGEGLMSILDLAADDVGNVYASGYLSNKLTVESTEYIGPGSLRPGYFIMKLDASGSLVWVNSTDWPNSRCSAIDWTSQGLAFGIAYSDSLRIGSEIIYETQSTASNHQDVAFGLLDEDGDLISSFNIGGSGDIGVSSIKCDDLSCILQGRFSGQLNYDGVEHLTSGSLHFSFYQISLSYQGAVNWSNTSVNNDELTVFSEDMGLLSTGTTFFSAAYGYSSVTIDGLMVEEPDEPPTTFLGKVNGGDGSVVSLLEIPMHSLGWNKPLTSNGDQLWIGGGFNSSEFTFGEVAIDNSELESFDGILLSLDKDGNVNCGLGIHGQGDNEVRAIEWSDGNHLVALVSFNGTIEFGGQTYTAQGNYDLLVIKACLPCDSLTDVGEVLNANEFVLLQNDPNPFSDYVKIAFAIPETANNVEILISDTKGSLINRFTVDQRGTGEITFYVSEVHSGVYNCSLIIDGRVAKTNKMVKN